MSKTNAVPLRGKQLVNNMAKLSVMVVDDDIYVRQALEVLIRRHPKTKSDAMFSNIDEAVKALSNGNGPDVIIMDINFQGAKKNGIDAIKEIKKLKGSWKILVSSMNNDQDTVLKAINAGADGFVWKNESAEGIVSAVIKLAEGRFVVTKSIAEKIMGTAVSFEKYVDILKEGKDYKRLTSELKKTLYLYCSCGMSAKEIAEELCLSVHTVNSRIKLCYQLLNATSRAEAFSKLVERET